MGRTGTLKEAFQMLVAGSREFDAKLKSSTLTDAERKFYQVKLDMIQTIFEVLHDLALKSERQKEMLNLCIEGGKCTSELARRIGFRSEDSLRYTKNQFQYFLGATVLNKEKVINLIQSSSPNEFAGVSAWYRVHVFENAELRRFMAST
jgi:hypothetical protein